jgi:hypothetical protein
MRLARYAFFALPVILMLGCGRSSAQDSASTSPCPDTTMMSTAIPLSAERLVFVSLVNGKPVPNIDPVVLDTTKGHVAHWIFGGDGELTITMKTDNPFATANEHAGNHERSGRVRSDAQGGGRHYSYTITLKTADGIFVNDPDIEIVP